MRLPSPSFLKKKGDVKYFLALLLRDESVTAVIFDEQQGNISHITSNEELFTTPIEEADIDEWLDTFDKAVSIAENKVKEEINLEKTIFGVKETWIQEGKIKKEYLVKLKKICDELSLSPIGFLVFSEAAMHLLQQQEGSPISTIFAEVGKKLVTVSLIKGGKVVESKSAKLETFNAPQIVDSVLKHFVGFEVFPPRIIVQNDNHEVKNEEVANEFSKHSWNKTLPFLHLPQVIILPQQFPTQAILAGAATQMGFTYSNINEKSNILTSDVQMIKDDDNINQDPKSTKNVEGDNFSPVETESFGFVHDEDIAIKEISHENKSDTYAINQHPNEKELEALEDSSVEQNKRISLPSQSMLLAGAIKTTFSKIPIKSILTKFPLKGGKLILIVPFLVLIVIGAIFYYFYSIKTTVSLALHPKTLSQTQNLSFTTQSTNDFDHNIITAEEVSVTENGSSQINATGKKDVGEKAKGVITIYNSSDNSKKFSSGTKITSDKGLTYSLDKDVSIASGSGDPIAPKSGSAQVNITAGDIGTDYNLPSGTTFSVDGESSSTVKGKNDSALSGGNKKSVTVVSKDDIAKLNAALIKTIEGQAKNDVSKKLSSNQELLSSISAGDVTGKKTTKNVGDQATTINITGNVSFKALAYKKDDMNTYAKKIIVSKDTSNQVLDLGSISSTISNIKAQKNGDIMATVEIKANTLPKIDSKQISKDIAGKSFEEATQIVTKLPQISGATITFSPNIPFLPKRISLNSNNIIVITHNE